MPKRNPEAQSTQQELILLDLSSETLKKQLELFKDKHLNEVFAALERFQEKVEKITWQQLYQQSSKSTNRKTGFNYEPLNYRTKSGRRVATIRISGKIRALVCRMGKHMVVISIHPDHEAMILLNTAAIAKDFPSSEQLVV